MSGIESLPDEVVPYINRIIDASQGDAVESTRDIAQELSADSVFLGQVLDGLVFLARLAKQYGDTFDDMFESVNDFVADGQAMVAWMAAKKLDQDDES